MLLAPVYPATVVADSALQSVLLRDKFKVGATRRYGMDMTTAMKIGGGANAMPMTFGAKVVSSQRIQSISNDGTATILSTIISSSMNINGQSMPMSAMSGAAGTMGMGKGSGTPAKSSTFRLSPTGKLVGTPAATGGNMMMAGLDPSYILRLAALPSGPVHVGSTWSVSGDGGNFTSKLVSIANGVATVKTEGSSDISKAMGQGTSPLKGAKGNVLMHIQWKFDIAGGYLRSLDSTINLNFGGSVGTQGGFSTAGTVTSHIAAL